AEAARVVDTTGAGDAFAAGLLEAFVTERPLAACVAAGTRLAARAVGVIGAQPR
ncbi:MAG: sugar kinase, partial [Geodermatophilaceae bacterium]|nr:sugar kinase [Geodermatophilaceae bacterium]